MKAKINQLLITLTRKISKKPEKFLAPIVLLTLLLASQIFFISFDTTTEGFLSKDDPSIVQLRKTQDQYGRGEFVLLTIENDNIFSLAFISRLQTLHQDLETNLPWLDSVESLLNARDTVGLVDELIVGELFSPFPTNEAQINEIKNKVENNPLLQNLIISQDGRFTTLVIKPLTYESVDNLELDVVDDLSFDDSFFDEVDIELEKRELLSEHKVGELISKVEHIVARYQSDDFKIYLGGMPVVTEKLIDTMIWEMLTFMPLAIVIIVLFLAILFRRRLGVQLPMMTVVFTLFSIVGLLSALRLPVQMPMMIVPTFILTVTVGGAVHLLTIFFRKFDETGEKQSSLEYAVSHSGIPILLTSLTTAAGLLSFVGSPIVPISRLGLFSALGVLIAYIYTMVLIPALICKLTVIKKDLSSNQLGFIEPILNRFSSWAIHHPIKILVSTTAIVIFCIFSIAQLSFSHNPLNWLPENLDARKAIETIDKNMGGSIPVEIVIDTQKTDGLYEPELLNKLDELTSWVEGYENESFSVAKVSGLTFVVKETHRALNEGKQAFYSIPNDKITVAQELFMFENSGPEELKSIVDSQFSQTRLAVIMPWIDTIKYQSFLEELQHKFDQTLIDEQGEVMAITTITGVVPVLGTTLFGVIKTMVQSYGIAFLVITVMMVLMLSSIKYGLLAMVPNLTPILIMLASMHWLNIPMDMFTVLVASIAIGIAVDDTVHFMFHFKNYLEQGLTKEESIKKTFDTSGRAMITTSIVLCLGFSMLMFSSMQNITNFGFLIAFTIFIALLAEFLIAPAMMMLTTKAQK